MPVLGNVELERILEKTKRKARLIAEKPVVGKDVPHRESISGRGLEWEIRGLLAAESEAELYAKEQALQALADGSPKTFDEYDDPSKDAYTVLVSDVEINRLAGQLHRSSYALRLLLKAIQYARLAKTYPEIAQQAQALLSYCYKVQSSTLPDVMQGLSYVLGVSVQAQTLPSTSQTLTLRTLGRTTYGKILWEPCESTSNWVEDPTYNGGTISAVTDYVKQGSYSIKYNQDSSTTTGFWYRSHGTQTGTYLVWVWVRPMASNKEFYFGTYNGQFAQNGDSGMGPCIGFMSDNYIKYGAVGWYTLQAYSAGTWYLICLKVKLDVDKFDVWIDGVSRATNANFYANNTQTQLTNFFVEAIGTYTGDRARYDNLVVTSGDSITVSGLPDGWYFKVRKGSNYYQSSSASGGSASLTCTALPEPPPFDELELYNSGGQLIFDDRFPGDVWPGDVYAYSQQSG